MSIARELSKSFSYPLNTPISLADKKDSSVPVYAEFQWSQAKEIFTENGKVRIGDTYKVYLKIQGSNEIVGDMDFELLEDQRSQTYIKTAFPCARIVDMHNTSKYIHVGKALFESALRACLDLGGKGRIVLEAVRDTSYFHYLNGFRVANEKYYLRLAKALLKAGNKRIEENVGFQALYLPRQYIESNIQKFGISHQLKDFETESAEERIYIQELEKIMAEAKQENLAIKVMLEIENYGFRAGEPSYKGLGFMAIGELMSKYKAQNPSLFCQTTKDILNIGFMAIKEQLPVDTAEKEKTLATLIFGTLVLAMAYQDAEYGEQDLYGKKLLYPYQKYSSLYEEKSIYSNILIIGEKVLNRELPFDRLNPTFFPTLGAISELQTFLDKWVPRPGLTNA